MEPQTFEKPIQMIMIKTLEAIKSIWVLFDTGENVFVLSQECA
jgi:hypothetical protein